MSNKRLTINMSANILAFAVNIGIGFFLTPYIIKTVGSEAYGFVGLANNFVSYASLITIALNSMAGRFITIEIHKADNMGANKYFNSVLLANTLMAIFLTIPSILIVLFLNKIINVSSSIYSDVQLLFVFIFLNFIISSVGSTFAIATFARNRLDISSMRGIESNILRVILLVGLFYFFKPSISYLGISVFIATVYIFISNIYYTKKLLPELKINKRFFDLKAVIELTSSGVWNTIMRLGQLLLDGLDLLITNLFISAAAMGTLAIAKTVPTFIISFVGMLAGVFVPAFTIKYAQNNILGLIKDIKQSMKIMGILVAIPISMLIAFGDIFYSLWTPTEDAKVLQTLSIITVSTLIISGSINSIYNVFTVTNKLKTNALWLISTGLINALLVFFLLNTTSWGLYAVTGVSAAISILRNLIYTAPYGAKYLGSKWTTFFPEIFRSIVSVLVITVIGLLLRLVTNIDTWIELFVFGGIGGIIGLVVNYYVVLNKSERKYFSGIIKEKIKRRF